MKVKNRFQLLIIDVPRTEDFEANRLALLNLAGDAISELSQIYYSIIMHDFNPEYFTQEEITQADDDHPHFSLDDD